MKKGLLIGGVVLTVLIAFGIASYGYAQSQYMANSSVAFGQGYGPGMMGRQGGRGGMMGAGQAGAYGPLHEYMEQAVAEEFGITVEEVEDLHDQGKTMWDYAQEQGLTTEQFQEKMVAARTSALEQAVAAGVITQAQADWMLERMGQMFQGGAGFGSCNGAGRFGGRGPGWRMNTPPTGTGG